MVTASGMNMNRLNGEQALSPTRVTALEPTWEVMSASTRPLISNQHKRYY